jgi:hypothetical protein
VSSFRKGRVRIFEGRSGIPAASATSSLPAVAGGPGKAQRQRMSACSEKSPQWNTGGGTRTEPRAAAPLRHREVP